jgi:diguanylate cyclase (GGDEF)-like protein
MLRSTVFEEWRVSDSQESQGLGESGAAARLQQTLPLEAECAHPGAELAALREASLILIAHPEQRHLGSRYRLTRGGSIEIGRAPTAEVSLPEVLSVSRNHARLHWTDDDVQIEDLGSTNGVCLNNRRIEGLTALQNGDRIQTGAVHFKFLLEEDLEHAYHLAVYELMMRDGLTELYNRRKFEEESQREFARGERYGRPLSLILFDIDLFKEVNDTHGHLAGDAVLKRMAALLSGHVRAEQVIARVGGEEFALLCPEVDAEGARALAERLREAIAQQAHGEEGGSFLITCSFGVAALGPGMASPLDLFAASDEALFRSKQSGRNRVSLALQA